MILGLSACEVAEPGWEEESVPHPAVFAPGVISTGLREYGIAFTPDGTEAYFTRRGGRGPSQILTSRFLGGQWTEPEVAPFALDRDEGPFITTDGRRMLFSSRRAASGSGDRSDNIWTVERGTDGWEEPRPLPGVVNQPQSGDEDFQSGAELGPIELPDGSLLYWTRVDPEWGSDLYVADRVEGEGYMSPRPLRISSYGDETNPAISPDGRFLVFQGYRDGNAHGEQDLYVSERTEYGWSDPWLLPEPINSPSNEGYPSFSPRGKHFFFASDRGGRGGFYDIYYVDYSALNLGAGER